MPISGFYTTLTFDLIVADPEIRIGIGFESASIQLPLLKSKKQLTRTRLKF